MLVFITIVYFWLNIQIDKLKIKHESYFIFPRSVYSRQYINSWRHSWVRRAETWQKGEKWSCREDLCLIEAYSDGDNERSHAVSFNKRKSLRYNLSHLKKHFWLHCFSSLQFIVSISITWGIFFTPFNIQVLIMSQMIFEFFFKKCKCRKNIWCNVFNFRVSYNSIKV